MSVQLDGHVVFYGGMKDLLEIDGEWLSVVDEPSGRMGQDSYGRMGERLEDSFRHRTLGHVHFCMNCGNDHIELFEKIVGEIEGAIR